MVIGLGTNLDFCKFLKPFVGSNTKAKEDEKFDKYQCIKKMWRK